MDNVNFAIATITEGTVPRPNANKRLKELEEIIKERRSKYLLLES